MLFTKNTLDRPEGHRPNATLGYRPDVDGMRALAVVIVVLYHAGIVCRGGFVGVDVFFVISGYLITHLLLRDFKEGRFSMAQFWERRVRRIFPAMFCMVLATFVAGLLLPSPSDLAEMGRVVVAQSLMSANWYYLGLGLDYFTDPGFQPLLHMWSLAVEEQFYLLFPLLLWGGRRYFFGRPNRLWIWMLAGFVGSLGLAVVWLPKNSAAVFYGSPTRAWEILGGALLAAGPAAWFRAGRWLRELSAWAGLLAILVPVRLYSDDTLFPGLAAVPPCLGAMALIWANSAGPASTVGSAGTLTLVGRVLAWRPVVFVGAISYSLYLWHVPVFAYLHYCEPAPKVLPLLYKVIPIAVSFVLALISWRWIETPFRQKRFLADRRALFCSAAAGTLLLLAAGAGTAAFGGFPSRMPSLVIANDAVPPEPFFGTQVSADEIKVGQIPRIGRAGPGARPEVLLWGDSHAKHTVPAMDSLLLAHGIAGEVITFNGIAPIRSSYLFNRVEGSDSPTWFDATLGHIRESGIRHVVLVARWSLYLKKGNGQRVETELRQVIEQLNALGCRVWILLDTPSYRVSVPRVLMCELFPAGWGPPRGEWRRTEAAHIAENATLYDLAASNLAAQFLDPAAGLLDPSTKTYRVESEGVSLYRDKDHLSESGALRVLLPVLEETLGKALAQEPAAAD